MPLVKDALRRALLTQLNAAYPASQTLDELAAAIPGDADTRQEIRAELATLQAREFIRGQQYEGVDYYLIADSGMRQILKQTTSLSRLIWGRTGNAD